MYNGKQISKGKPVEKEEILLSVHDVSKVINRSDESVRIYSRQGKLRSLRTAGGWRIFRLSDVKKFAEKYLGNEDGTASARAKFAKKSDSE